MIGPLTFTRPHVGPSPQQLRELPRPPPRGTGLIAGPTDSYCPAITLARRILIEAVGWMPRKAINELRHPCGTAVSARSLSHAPPYDEEEKCLGPGETKDG